MLCGWEVKAGMSHSTCGCTCGWQVTLRDLTVTRAIPELIRNLLQSDNANLYKLYFAFIGTRLRLPDWRNAELK